MRLATAAVVLIGAIAVAGCNNQPPAPKTYTVIIASMAYAPTPPAVRTGDTIHWVNNDIFQHSVTAKYGSFDVDLQPKASADTVIKHAGTIDFFCKYHPGMTGRLSVAG